jgi:hypothetical protein
MEAIVERPTLHDQQVARESLPFFAGAIAVQGSEGIRIRIQIENGHLFSVMIPAKALNLLAFILQEWLRRKPFRSFCLNQKGVPNRQLIC